MSEHAVRVNHEHSVVIAAKRRRLTGEPEASQ
jgi:hypothetical protein